MKADDYRWEIGLERGRMVAIAYLVGYPLRRAADETTSELVAAARQK
jgi:hypothetical protein